MRLYHPEPPHRPNRVHPVFIPFAGCPERCVFCAQDLQSGQAPQDGQEAVRETLLLASALSQISSAANTGPASQTRRTARRFAVAPGPPELAFYGGTFTALPVTLQETLLREARSLKELGRISRVRCSTRPDAITPEILQRLQKCGLDDIELGVQSFCSEPLAASRRSYSRETAMRACRLTREHGFGLGIQLMPGMPGMSPEHFRRDVEICAELEPDTARLYPCLVLEGTRLAELWRKGEYAPWSLKEVLEHLPPAMLALWERGIRIIRIGLAPQPELEKGLLAGPAHPALGQRLRSLALFAFLSGRIGHAGQDGQAGGRLKLAIPRRFQGEFFGHRGELKEKYASLGLRPDGVTWWDEKYFKITTIRN